MKRKNRHDRFYIARYKRAVKKRKRTPYLKASSNFKFKPFMGYFDQAFFASREERAERMVYLKQDKQIASEQLKLAKQSVNKQKNRKKYISFIFLAINLIVVFFVLKDQIDSQGFATFSQLVNSGANFNYIYLALLCMPMLVLIDWARFQVIIYKVLNRSRHFLSYKVAALGKYYDFVTPLGTGGQPFQVFYLNKRGMKKELATSVPLVKYIFSQIVFVLFAILAIFTNSFASGNNAIVVGLAWVGIGLNSALIFTIFLLSVSKNIGYKIVVGVLKFLNKIKIIKDYEKAFQRVVRFVREYQKSIRYVSTNFKIIVILLVLSILYVLVEASVPFLIYTAFNGFDSSMWWTLVSKLLILQFAVSFVPLPGGAGANELSFAAMFSSLFESIPGSFFWAILIWRFATYYAFILQGIGVIIYDIIVGDKKAAKLKKIGFWEDFRKKNWFKLFARKNSKVQKKLKNNKKQ